MNQKRDLLIAFTVGAVAGSVTALLLAPDKGENTRRKLKEGADRMLKNTSHRIGDTAEEVRSTLRSQGKAVKEAVHTARETYRSEVARAREEDPAEVRS